MNKKLYLLASAVVLATAVTMAGVAFVQGDFKGVSFVQQKETAEDAALVIQLSGETATTDAEGVTVAGNQVTIAKGGHYELQGEAATVSVMVDAAVGDDVKISLNNAALASISIQSTGTNIVHLVDGTTNRLSGVEAGITATNITVTGNGNLDMTEIAKYGIFATEDLVVESGTLNITSAGSGLYTIHESNKELANLTINGGTINITASEAEGTAGLLAGNTLIVNNGNINVLSSYEGYVGKYITINGGVADIKSTDDGIVSKDPFYEEGAVSDVDVTINGGETRTTSAGDGLDSNGSLTIAGGNNIFTSTSLEHGALDYEGNGLLSGGTLWAVGVVSAAQGFTEASQNYLAASLYGYTGETISVTDAAGTVLATTVAGTDFSYLLFSSADLVAGEVYYISTSSGAQVEVVAGTVAE